MASKSAKPPFTKAVVRERFALCKACPYLVNVPGLFKGMEKCIKCGCFARAKVQIRSFKCPAGKW